MRRWRRPFPGLFWRFSISQFGDFLFLYFKLIVWGLSGELEEIPGIWFGIRDGLVTRNRNLGSARISEYISTKSISIWLKFRWESPSEAGAEYRKVYYRYIDISIPQEYRNTYQRNYRYLDTIGIPVEVGVEYRNRYHDIVDAPIPPECRNRYYRYLDTAGIPVGGGCGVS